MALPLHTHAEVHADRDRLLKVLDIREALAGRWPLDRVALDLRDGPSVDLEALANLGLAGVVAARPAPRTPDSIPVRVIDPRVPKVVAPGDAIRVRPGTSLVSNLYRRGANANTLFATEMCNSRCVMCSQPPREEDDRSWRLREMLDLVPLIDRELDWLGVSGGEPTLLGDGLVHVIEACARELPSTRLHILTNGRRFADEVFSERFTMALDRVVWAVPLYADIARLHDHVVQAHGAFEETLNGLYTLGERRHRLEIRLVLHALTIDRLGEFASFIYRNLPFVEHVALMGLEPMGYAKLNRDQLWVDPVDYGEAVTEAAWFLADRGIAASIYNVPLCTLPRRAWPLARRSISDWKNAFDPACMNCAMRDECCGFFVSAGAEWKSRAIRPVDGGDHGEAGGLGTAA